MPAGGCRQQCAANILPAERTEGSAAIGQEGSSAAVGIDSTAGPNLNRQRLNSSILTRLYTLFTDSPGTQW